MYSIFISMDHAIKRGGVQDDVENDARTVYLVCVSRVECRGPGVRVAIGFDFGRARLDFTREGSQSISILNLVRLTYDVGFYNTGTPLTLNVKNRNSTRDTRYSRELCRYSFIREIRGSRAGSVSVVIHSFIHSMCGVTSLHIYLLTSLLEFQVASVTF
ncbi:hypothetical protein B0H12DRAFT_94053 [Mycena haematopus]|nr:hypothetical protein B0H12DRAFT_94053 [Mycena haematopus]